MTRELHRLIEAAEDILATYGVDALNAALRIAPEQRTPLQQGMIRLNASLRYWRRV